MNHSETSLRADIQFMRALAVGLVVVFHVWPSAMPGGYVGVDVFFVISGYLIYSQLLRELERRGEINILLFWSRRIKRLQPAAFTVLFATTFGVLLWVPHSLWLQWLKEIVASALQVQNWLLGFDAVDYLAAENDPSPVQHYWSLSVEEQFYVALPLFLIGLVWGARRYSLRLRNVLSAGLVTVALGSLLFSVWQTSASSSIAYFSSATRAWEFALGALLVHIGDGPASRLLRNAAVAVGLSGVAISANLFNSETSFPGLAALIPVFGTLLCLWAGRRSFLDFLGSIRPLAALGHYSYSIYLWHWPLIVLSAYAVFHWPFYSLVEYTGGDKQRVAIVVATLVLAKLTTDRIEDPIRFNSRILEGGARKRVVLVSFLAILAVLVVICAMAAWKVKAQERTSDISPELVRINSLAIDQLPQCFGAKAMDVIYAEACAGEPPNNWLLPDLAKLKDDNANLEPCWIAGDVAKRRFCSFGPEINAAKRILVIGDSHAGVLMDAYAYVAEKNGWRVDVAGRPGCYLTSAKQKRPSEEDWARCQEWRKNVIDYANSVHYDAFIVTHSSSTAGEIPEDGESQQQAIVRGLVSAWEQLPSAPIVAIVDNPYISPQVRSCLHVEGQKSVGDRNLPRCSMPREKALMFDGQKLAAETIGPRVKLVDMTDFYCSRTECPAVIGNVIVYRDGHHLTRVYAKSLAPYLYRSITAALAEVGPGKE